MKTFVGIEVQLCAFLTLALDANLWYVTAALASGKELQYRPNRKRTAAKSLALAEN